MSNSILDALEAKITQAVETIQLLQLEIEELKGKNDQLAQEKQALNQEFQQLKDEHQNWQERLRALMGQIENV